MVKSLTDDTFASAVQSDKPVLVDFWASWCGPCKMLSPIIEEIAEEFNTKIDVAKMDVDANPVTTNEFNLMSIPTMLVFQNGKVVKQLVGYRPKADLIHELADFLA